MKVEELFALVRQEVDDVAVPPRAGDAYLLDALVDAENEACRRGRLLLDSDTAATCQIAVTAGTAVYSLDSRVIQVNRIEVDGEDAPLTPAMQRDLDQYLPGWRADTSTMPEYWVPDWGTGKIRLVPSPTANVTLNLTVERLPLVEVDQTTEDEPEIAQQYHRNLRHWMIYRFYSQRDSEVNNDQLADKALMLFEREFGPPRPAYDEQWIAQHYQHSWVGRY